MKFLLESNANNTVQFLNKLDSRSKKRREEPDIPCKPAFKVIEDELVVGILTNTNQFIQISDPIQVDDVNKELDLPSITNEDYIVNSKKKPMLASDILITTQNWAQFTQTWNFNDLDKNSDNVSCSIFCKFFTLNIWVG